MGTPSTPSSAGRDHSRLPLFKHVKSMLHKPPLLTTPGTPKWDEYTGELSETGKAPKVKPSTYISTYEGAFTSSRRRSPQRPSKAKRNDSPVSVLDDGDLTPVDGTNGASNLHSARSPVSPVSAPSLDLDDEDVFEDKVDPSLLPDPLSPNVQRKARALPQTPSISTRVKRKPTSRDFSAENYPPVSEPHNPSQSDDVTADIDAPATPSASAPPSHFSWTTYAAPTRPGHASINTQATRQAELPPGATKSRFSWSTVATNATRGARADSPLSSPPPIPADYVQSILSRSRPVQRTDKEDWSPPTQAPRARSDGNPPSAPSTILSSPLPSTTIKPLNISKTSTPKSKNSPSAAKALPLPPQLSADNNLTRLETLLAQERDAVLQRRNVERAIGDLEKVERASPLDVPFSTVRDAKKRLAEYRTRLDEVRLEERNIGIAIARARKREEEVDGDETLWVRRVTN
ncbi:hypothetical protein BDY17DRAFT_320463 [Neohortaea acidophila]|uniref:Uncharacterized protein n=1 Tax=Neohortaea acidophila TaxID=245834 RepID=A0A6A6Q8I6_9PEZI|nr:uncharacterized protein BDY17DRAFT_320463 [Neohortaea acidophila]KAF2487953.1 hypothetical protein BDY17DRAFT_320463 [Neohortaea acidophila]